MIESLEQQLGNAEQTPSTAQDLNPLDPRVVNLWRVVYLITFGVILSVLLVSFVAIGWNHPSARPWVAAAWVAAAVVCAGFSFWHPRRYYNSWGWRIGEKVLEVRSGRLIERTRLVPLPRLQHVDLQRGPLERLFGLASLIIHTAGTHAASTTIPGLDAAEAARLRDHLVEIGGDDAV